MLGAHFATHGMAVKICKRLASSPAPRPATRCGCARPRRGSDAAARRPEPWPHCVRRHLQTIDIPVLSQHIRGNNWRFFGLTEVRRTPASRRGTYRGSCAQRPYPRYPARRHDDGTHSRRYGVHPKQGHCPEGACESPVRGQRRTPLWAHHRRRASRSKVQPVSMSTGWSMISWLQQRRDSQGCQLPSETRSKQIRAGCRVTRLHWTAVSGRCL